MSTQTTMKEKEQILAMLELLKLQRKGIPQRNFFGDNNHANNDKMSNILTKALAQTRAQLLFLRNKIADPEAQQHEQDAYNWLLCEVKFNLIDPGDMWVWKAVGADQQLTEKVHKWERIIRG